MPIRKFDEVPLREVWKHEERDFSAWLAENIDALSEALGISLSEAKREVTVGSFNVDIVAEDAGGNLAIIENQLEATDHDHLGKLLTYLTNLEAKTAIWITSNPRPEHVKSVAWLNEATPVDISFYLVKVGTYRIGDSDPAPLFTTIVGPSEQAKDIGQQKKELAERVLLRLRFWEQLLTRAKEKGVTLHAAVSPSKDNWIWAGAGKTGLAYLYRVLLEKNTAVELYIDTRDKETNKRIFDLLHSRKKQIETDFGDSLEWERNDHVRFARIKATILRGGLKDGERKWADIQDALIDSMDRLSRSLRSHIQALEE